MLSIQNVYRTLIKIYESGKKDYQIDIKIPDDVVDSRKDPRLYLFEGKLYLMYTGRLKNKKFMYTVKSSYIQYAYTECNSNKLQTGYQDQHDWYKILWSWINGLKVNELKYVEM